MDARLLHGEFGHRLRLQRGQVANLALLEGPAHFELMQLPAAVLHLLYQRLDRWLLLGKDFLCLRLLCVRQVKVIGEELKLVFTEHSTAVHVSTSHRLRYCDCCGKRQNAGDN